MNSSNEFVCAKSPFTVRRTVRWIDCDPAGLAFAGRLNDYLISAMMLFYRHINWGPESTVNSLSVGLPCKYMAMTFHQSLKPNTTVDICIHVGAIRKHSFDLLAQAYLAENELAFEGQFSPVCTRSDYRRSTAIPGALLDVLRQHQSLT